MTHQGHNLGVSTVKEKGKECVEEYADKLDHLQSCQVPDVQICVDCVFGIIVFTAPSTSSTRGKAAFSVQMPRGNSRGTSPGEFSININICKTLDDMCKAMYNH